LSDPTSPAPFSIDLTQALTDARNRVRGIDERIGDLKFQLQQLEQQHETEARKVDAATYLIEAMREDAAKAARQRVPVESRPDQPIVAPVLAGAMPPVPRPGFGAPLRDTRHKTPERVVLLRELWVKGGPPQSAILAALNKLPGAEIPARQLSSYVIQWGIATSARDERRPNAAAQSAEAPPGPTKIIPLEPAPPPALRQNGTPSDISLPAPTFTFGPNISAEGKALLTEAAHQVGLSVPSPDPPPAKPTPSQAPVPAPARVSLAALFPRADGKPSPAPAPAPGKPIATPPAARPVVSGVAAANGPPVRASVEAIRRWGETRGIITRQLDLERVNATRRRLLLPPFEVETAQPNR
jgi:hypothetical protein